MQELREFIAFFGWGGIGRLFAPKKATKLSLLVPLHEASALQ